MRVALAIATTIALPVTALAQTPAPAPAPAPAPPSTPSPDPASAPAPDPTSAPGETPPQPVPAPPADPAYGEHPEPNYDTRNFPAPTGKDVIIVSYPDRSKKNIMTLAILGGAGVLAGAVGFYFHMDYRSAADDVGTNDYTGEVWTSAHQDTYDRAHGSSIAAGVLYGIGGGLLLATAITYIVTEPEPETMIIHPHVSTRTKPLVVPTQGGAMIGGKWSF